MESLGDKERSNSIQYGSKNAPAYSSFQHTSTRQVHGSSALSEFTIFSKLPPEIRSTIWRAAITPRIIKWTRIQNTNNFEVPTGAFTLFDVCIESRQVVMLYGEYRDISTTSIPIYFSPLFDYLFFDAGWIHLIRTGPIPDPLDFILPDFADVHKIMVHPNFTDDRKKPSTLFERLPKLNQLLIGADEKSMGAHKKFILSSLYDAKMYYAAKVMKENSNAKVPHIAVGCLGWRGAERMSLRHGTEDNRQLVGIFQKDFEMTNHLNAVREEERRFLEQSFRMTRPKLTLHLRPVRHDEEACEEVGNDGTDVNDVVVCVDVDMNPPSYSKVVECSISEGKPLEGSIDLDPNPASGHDQNKKVNPRNWFNRMLRGQILSLENSSTVIVKRKE